jgi:aerobic-type carbon monoxide dehydrogenase small subunit (CoxS/CutS family)
MKLVFCSCGYCKAGRHSAKRLITSIKRASRRKVKSMLKHGEWENLPEKVSVPYLG